MAMAIIMGVADTTGTGDGMAVMATAAGTGNSLLRIELVWGTAGTKAPAPFFIRGSSTDARPSNIFEDAFEPPR